MKYYLYPGCEIPNLIEGDIVYVKNKAFIYRGSVPTYDQIPYGIEGLYFIEATRKYNLRHNKKYEDIIALYRDYELQSIAQKTVPTLRNKVHKEVFAFPVEESDNYLKVLVKKILLTMKVDMREYRNKFRNDNDMNNMKRLISSGKGKLTYEKFVEWLEVLGYSHTITLYDPEGNPITEDITHE
jgi:hypothetical protein